MIVARLAARARAELGELVVETIYYPESRQLTAVLIGNERVVYDAQGQRVTPRHDRQPWDDWLQASALLVVVPVVITLAGWLVGMNL